MPDIQWAGCWFEMCHNTLADGTTFTSMPKVFGTLWALFLVGFMLFVANDHLRNRSRIMMRNPSRIARWAQGRNMKQVATAGVALIACIGGFLLMIH